MGVRPWPLGWLALAVLHSATLAAVPVSPSTQELLRAAQMWSAKNRPDMVQQLLDKLAVLDPDSPQVLAAMGEFQVREGRPEQAVAALDALRARHPKHPLTRELEGLLRVNTAEREKLAAMRLMARAGRKAEAAALANELFPQGPPTLGGLALEVYAILAATDSGGDAAQRELQRLLDDTGDSRYAMALIDRQLARNARGEAVLPRIEALARQPDVSLPVLRDLWLRALDRTAGSGQVAHIRRYLERFPGETAMVERLAAAQQAQERAAQAARDPVNVARRRAAEALDRGELPMAEEQLLKVLGARPRDAESLGNLGLVRLRQGQHEQALALFEQAQALSPDRKWQSLQATTRFWGLLRQADVAVDQGELPLATELTQKALSMQPGQPEALVTLAGIRQVQGDLPGALDLYRQALSREPDHKSALRGLANGLAKQGDSEQALAVLDKAMATDETLARELAPARAGILSEQADALIQAKRHSAAMQVLESAVLLAPRDPWIRHRLARLYLRLGLPKVGLSVVDDGVALMPSDPDMAYARALIRSAAGDDAGALADVGRIAAADRSEGMNALVRRAVIGQMLAQALEPGWGDRSAGLLAEAERRAGDDPGLVQSVAQAWARRGQPEQGLAVMDRLLMRVDEPDPALLLVHAEWMNRARDDRTLAKVLPRLLQRAGWTDEQQNDLLTLEADHRARLIEDRLGSGQTAQARQLAREPLPPSADATRRARLRARLLLAASEHADAVTELETVLRDSPDDADVRFDLAQAQARLGRTGDARVHAQWLQSHVPTLNTAQRLALVRLWLRLGDDAQAQRVMEALLSDVQARANVHAQAAGQPGLSAVLIRRHPSDDEVLLAAARMARSAGDYARAVDLFQQALRITALGAALTTDAAPADANEVAAPDGGLQLRLSAALAVVPVDPGADIRGPSATGDASLALARIQRDIDAIEARRQSWVEAGQKQLHKPGTAGISALKGWERAWVAWWPRGYDGHHFLHVDQVSLNAGTLSANRTDVTDFGQVGAWPAGLYPVPAGPSQGRGTHVGWGFDGDRQTWDVGVTGIGLPVTNLVGGWQQSGDWRDWRYQLGVSRRPMTGSLLSYAGAADPITGKVWGGVVATGVSGRLSGDVGPTSVSWSVAQHWLTGRHVLGNQRLSMRWAADQDVYRGPASVVNAGVALAFTRHAHDLSEYSWGHGGYYSPQRLLSLSVPLEWSGRSGAWTWELRGALTWSHSSSAAIAQYPNDPGVQAQAGNPVFGGSSSSGLGRSLKGAVEHQLTRNLALGALLEWERSTDYSPTNLLLYARYFFDPVRVPLENRPRPVKLYSGF